MSDKLRRASCSFVREKLTTVIKSQLIELGISESEFEVNVNITSITTTDPEIIEIHYKSIYPNDTDYIRNKVLVEVSGRSMSDPIEAIEVRSMIAEALPNTKYADAKFKLMAVSPKRTFLEKACLLHEEFAQTTRAVRVDRMSRHLYDLERMVASGIADTALADEELYRAVIEHRRKFIGLKGFDYSELLPQNISFVPPADIRKAWQEDYKSMQESMIYGISLDFETLIERIIELNRRFNAMNL